MLMVYWIKRLFLFLVLMMLFTSVYANPYATEVKHAETTLQNNTYFLAVDLDYHISPKANEALQNGVPLFWKIKVKLKEIRPFWFDKTELKIELRYRLQYHALLKMYRIRNENTGAVNNFSTLNAALNDMSTIRDLSLIDKEKLLLTSNYVIAVKVSFEDSELPLPLQTQLITSSQWQLSSDWTQWDLTN